MNIKNLTVLLLLFLVFACGSSKSEAELAYEQKQFQEIKSILEAEEFVFTATVAYPMQSNAVIEASNALFQGTDNTGARINITDGTSTIEVNGEEVEISLAYFGQMQSGYYSDDRNTSIKFSGKPETKELLEDKDKKKIIYRLTLKNSTEQFNVKMDVFLNKRCIVQVFGANRTSIRYEGELKAIQKL